METKSYQDTRDGTPKINKLFRSANKEIPYFYWNEQVLKTEDSFTKKFGTGFDNIKYIENFLTQDDIKEYLHIVSKYPEIEGRDHCYPLHIGHPKSLENLEYVNFKNKMGKKMIAKANEVWKTPMSNLDNQGCHAVIHPSKTYLNPHTDNLNINYKNNDPDHDEGMIFSEQVKKFPNLWSGHLAILAYINDDFEGGEFYFPDFDYHFKPKAGSILMFPGGLHYIHGVTEVTKGTRYTLSQWCLFDFYTDSKI